MEIFVWGLIIVILQTNKLNCSPRDEQTFLEEPMSVISVLGDTVTLKCIVKNLEGEVQWTKNDFGLGTDINLSSYTRYSVDKREDEKKL